MTDKNRVFLLFISLSLFFILLGCDNGDSASFQNVPANYHIDKPLDTVYNSYFPIGAAVSAGEYSWTSWSSYNNSIMGVFNSLVAENCMKPALIHPDNNGVAGDYNWTAADAIINYADTNNMLIRGHVLLWHSQTPSWMTSGTKAEVQSKMQSHVTTIVNRYKDDIYCWDVVNEAISDSGGYRTDSPWYTAYGDATYIADAFDYAYAADSDCKLYYNDYNVVASTKRDSIVNMINNLDLIDSHHMRGIGIQAHWSLTWPSITQIQQTIDVFKAMGLEVQITELDIDIYNGDGSLSQQSYTPELEAQLAARYKELFELFRSNSDVITGVTFWGVADDHSWLNHFWDGVYHNDEFRQNYPMPFDTSYSPKFYYKSITDF